MRKFLKLGILAAVAAVAVIISGFGVSSYVKSSTESQIVDGADYSRLKDVDCILVLGAGLFGDKPSPMLKDRLITAVSLYKDGVAKKILMTGDHGRKCYDEVTAMKDFAVQMGVPEEDIFRDHAGFSSYDSVYRAKEVFGARKIVIVTQRYHLYRSLYVANKLGICAYGVDTNSRSYVGDTYREVREVFARFKDVVKCVFKPKPRFLGERIPLNQNGSVT